MKGGRRAVGRHGTSNACRMPLKKKKEDRSIVATVIMENPTQGEVQTGLQYLCKRYGMSREGIYKVRRFLGHPTSTRNKYWYSKQERKELDYYHVAVGSPWGLQMSRADYEREVLDKPPKEDGSAYTLNDWLIENEKLTFNQYVENKGHSWLISRYDN